MAVERWKETFAAAVAADNGEVFNDVVFDFGIEIMNLPSFPREDFEFLMECLHDRRLHGLKGAWNLLAVFAYEFDRLTGDQEDRLLKTLIEVHASFSDWMSPFYISELVGKNYADGRGLDAFERMKRTKNQVARSFVPYGLEHLARTTRDSLLANRAIDIVLSMRGDISEQVNAEVDQVIERMVDRGAIGRA
jgi:hypothetical protein